eukprot:7537282-Pyramimonas_sp.AAC.1
MMSADILQHSFIESLARSLVGRISPPHSVLPLLEEAGQQNRLLPKLVWQVKYPMVLGLEYAQAPHCPVQLDALINCTPQRFRGNQTRVSDLKKPDHVT